MSQSARPPLLEAQNPRFTAPQFGNYNPPTAPVPTASGAPTYNPQQTVDLLNSAAPPLPPAATPNNSAVMSPAFLAWQGAKTAAYKKKYRRKPSDQEMQQWEQEEGVPQKFTTADQRNNATPEQMAAGQTYGRNAATSKIGYQGTGPGGKSLLATLPPNSTPAAAPMFDAATSAGMAPAMRDAANGITSRGGGVVTTQGGGIIMDGPSARPPTANAGQPTSRTLASPYGSGSVTFAPAGTKPPGDPNLRALTSAIKTRQSQGIYTPANPAVQPVTAAPPTVARSSGPGSPASLPPATAAPTAPPPVSIDQNIAQARSTAGVLQAVNQKWAQANAPAPQTVQGLQTKPAFMTAAPPLPSTVQPPSTTVNAGAASPQLPSAAPPAPGFFQQIGSNIASNFGGSALGQEAQSAAAEVKRIGAGASVVNSGIKALAAPLVKAATAAPAAIGRGLAASPGFKDSVLDKKLRTAAPPPPPRSLVLR